MTFMTMVRKPSAFVPLAMSLLALGTVLFAVDVLDAVHQADEGGAAHIFQLLIVAQVPIVGYFVIRSLRQDPGSTLQVLVLQVAAVGLALWPVLLHHL